MSFFDEFNHIVTYTVKVNVGKNRQFKTDESTKSNSNHKGKMVAFYGKPKTLEELEKYGPNTFMKYVPAENVSLPIDIQISGEEELIPVFEESSKYTDRERTHHVIRIFNKDKIQVGYSSLALTPSGDISERYNFYHSADENETIRHTTYNNIEGAKIIKDDIFEFEKRSKEGSKKVKICQRDGKVVGCSVVEEDSKTKEDIMFQSITEFAKDEETPKLKRYVASCVADETEYSKRGGMLIPWECRTLESDLTEYLEVTQNFQRYAKWIEDETGIEVSIENAIEMRQLSYDRRESLGLSSRFNLGYLSSLAEYLKDENNNRLKEFKGDYIGNILKLTDNGYEACIVTKHQKDGQDYRLYTLIDLTGTSITRGTGMEEYEGIGRDQEYYKRLKEADKKPKFVTKIGKDGKEELVLYHGKAISGECPEYNQFVEDFITPLSEVRPIKISEFLSKEKGQNR